MRIGDAMARCGSWLRTLVLTSLAVLAQTAGASTAPPHHYYVLGPEPLTGPLSLMSLEPNNTITFGSYQLTLQQYQTASVPASAFTSGTKFSGTGFFTVGSAQNATDLLVPDDFAGTAFVVPHVTGSHKYFLLSPSGTAQVTIRIGANVFNVSAAQGVVNEFDAGSDNSAGGRITSDAPIVVTHVAYVSGSARDAYPVAPAASDLFGIRSQNTLIGALNDGTSLTVYGSNGSSNSYSLDAGQQVAVATGAGTSQGQGSSLHVVASGPVAVVQYDDGDGADATAFWSAANAARRHGLPVDAQYLAIACDQPSVSLTLYRGANAPEAQSCSGSSTTPGKAYFGASSSGANLKSGWYLIASSPVYAMYEASASEDEHNLLGLTPVAGPAAPTLNSIASPTSNNPQAVSGTAGANQLVRLYVNGLLQATTTANGSGNYSFNAALIDGTNTLYATAVTSGNESDPSNAMSVDYNNTIPRSQSGTISGTIVWTPGNPATPYTITAADLTIASGAQLILQPGTQLRFGSGRRITVNGTLAVNGTAGSNVVFTSNLASPTKGSWQGLVVSSTATNVLIEYAQIEWAVRGVEVGSGATATIRNSTIRNFSDIGIYFNSSASGSLASGNLIDNLNDQNSCIWVLSASPTIQGNTLTNCQYGLQVQGTTAAPLVNGNNIITSNQQGLRLAGNTTSPQPVVTGNQIFGNTTWNAWAGSYVAGASSIKLNFTGNWWGSTDPTTIGNLISDLTDSYTSTTAPVVDYANFLDGPNGASVPGNYLNGPFTAASTTLTAGVTYQVLGTLFVGTGKSLTIPAGTTVRFHGAPTRLVVDGTLNVQGASGNLATLTSGRASPARGDWQGVLIRGTTSTVVDYALIEWSVRGVEIAANAVATISNSTVRNFSETGIYFNSAAAASLASGNLIDNLNDQQDCMWVWGASPTIQGNTLRNCDIGLGVQQTTAAPLVNGNNIITSNAIGVRLSLNSTSPQPVVTGNQIFGNTSWNVYANAYLSGAQNIKLNFTGNWWGSTDATTIGTVINDLTDSYTSLTLPVVDYSNFLDGPNGAPVPGNFLIGPFTAASTTLTAGATYQVLGTLFVSAGKSLTIPAGTTLHFHNAPTRLVVDGTLSIQGTSGNLVTLTSGRATPARGDWPGILVRGTTPAVINYALIEWAVRGVEVGSGATATITNSTVRNFSDMGIYFNGSTSASLATGNLIDNLNDQQDCMWVTSASPTIQGNALSNCDVGLGVQGNTATPQVNGNNVITSNVTGVRLSNNSTSPQPVVTGNQIFGNTGWNVYANAYLSGAQNIKLNFTGNWWGSTDATTIGAFINDLTDNYLSVTWPVVDYASFLDGPNGASVPGNYLDGPLTAISTTLTAGATYQVIGTVFVGSGKSLTIPAGTTLRFHGALTRIVVDGTLSIQGASGNLVTLTSGRPTPARGDWPGILIRSTAPALIDYTLVEWADNGVEVASNAVATISNSTFRNFSNVGIYFNGAAAASLATNNLIDNLNDQATCLWVMSSSPTIQGNTVRNCGTGIVVRGTSSTPTINGNNIVTGNVNGFNVGGSSSSPQPVVTGNQIFGNTSLNVLAAAYLTGAQNIKLNFTGNWWGTTDPIAIGTFIFDLTDNYLLSTAPTVDYSNFLDGPSGTAVPGNYLIGPFTATSTTLSAGTTYDVLGTLFVNTGKTLTIPAGTTLRFYGGETRLVVDGTLSIQGTSGSPVTLTSARATPARGDWPGVLIRGTAPTVVDHALIEWAASPAIEVAPSALATISNSTIRNFSDIGIYFNGSASASQAIGNLIDNLDDLGTCIWIATNSPTIQGNTVRNCASGIMVRGTSSAPAINSNNIVTSNNIGLNVGGSSTTPQPVVTGNQIFGNTSWNALAAGYLTGAQNIKLNFTGNWWGTTDPIAIARFISDLTDNYTSATIPTIDYSNFLDGPNGAPVPGNYLIGPLSAASTTLTAGATYEVLGTVFVGTGKSLTIPAGATLRFYGTQARLVVDGALSIQGTVSAPVRLTSGLADPANGAWLGVEVRSTATSVLIDYAVIEWANRSVGVTTATATIRNSIIRSFSESGIWMSGVSSASQITGNYIDNLDATDGVGIWLVASSPAITGNQIYRCSIGIYAFGASNPSITGNAISNNVRGIELDGNNSNSASAVPNPVITGNDIFGNTFAQIEIYRYGASNPVVINATNNWWGTGTPQSGQQIKFTGGSPSSVLNFSNPAQAPQNGPVSGNVLVSPRYFSPNADSVQDTTAISAALNQPASWTVTIRNSSYAAVRTFSGSGTAIAATWDGRNGSGQLLSDATYSVEVTAVGALGSTIVGTRLTTLDNTVPATAITSPAASAVISNVLAVPVTGSANDAYLVNFTLQYGVGTAPSTWTTINSQTTSGISNGQVGNWVINSVDATIALANGPYVLRLSTSDKAGNVGSALVPVTLDTLSISAVSQNRQIMKPLLGEQLQVDFTLGGPATVYLRIYPEADGPLVKEIPQVFASGGAKSMIWDGRNAANAFVAGDAYNYAIFATDGVRTATYDPPRPSGIGSGGGGVDTAFNANRNDFFKINYSSSILGRARMQVSGCGLAATHYPYNWVPVLPGVTPLMWDGRGPDGQLTSGTCSVYFDAPRLMKPAIVIVRGTVPVITGTGASPNVEVKSNPYRIFHSYEQLSKITYRLDQDSYVTVKLLPPGVSDPASPQAIVITNNELQSALSGGQPADHVFEWKGYDDLDTNNILVSAEGTYTFTIQATSVATGATSLYRGALQLWQ